jgi:trimeric autotransporter adhesin
MRTGRATEWRPSVRGTFYFDDDVVPDPADPVVRVLSMARSGDTLYVAGRFDTIDDVARVSLAAFNTVSGQLETWTPLVESEPLVQVSALAHAGETLYMAGNFSSVNGQPRSRLAAVDTISGGTQPWQPRFPDASAGPLYSMAVSDDCVYVAQSVLAAFDRGDGNLGTSWDVARSVSWVGPAELVRGLVLSGTTLYVGGQFDIVDGVQRKNLCVIDTQTAVIREDWGEPDGTPQEVAALAIADGTLYVGSVGGVDARDAASGQPLPWGGSVMGGEISALAVDSSKVYVGGSFSSAFDELRTGLAFVAR